MAETNTIEGAGHFGKLSLGAEWQRSVRREQLSALVRMTPFLALVNIANALLLAFVLGDSVPLRVMAPWVIAIVVVAILMLTNWRRNRRKARRGSGSIKAIHRAAIFAAVVGLAWALAAPLFTSFLGSDDHVFLYIVLAGMVAGGAISLASVPRASIAFVSPILVVVLIYIVVGGEPEHFALGAMLVLFFATTALAQRETPSAVSASAASNYTRDLLSDILDMVPEGFALYDSNDRLFICNDTYRNSMPQLTEMIVPGISFEDLARAGAEKGLVANVEGGIDAYVHARMQHHRDPQGPYEYYQTRGHWIRTHERRLADASTIVIREDVTAQKLAEQARERSEERFRDFAESSADWLWEMDADLRFTYFSPNVENVVGAPPEWHYGKTRRDMLGDDYDHDVWDRHLQDLQAHRPFRDLTYLRHGEGGIEPKWLSASGQPYFDDEGTFQGYRGVGRDITEQYATRIETENAHKRLSLALESMDQGFVLFDENDEFVLCNSRFREFNPDIARMLVPGASYEELLMTAGGTRFLAGVDRGEAWLEERLKLHRAGNTQFEELHHDGRWFRVDETRTPDGWHVGLRTDITEQKRTELELRQSHERFQVIAETIPVPAVITRRSDDVLLFANEATARFTDRSFEDLRSKVLETNWVDPKVQEQYFGELERFGRVTDFEVMLRRSNGDEMSVLLSSRLTDFDEEEAIFTSFIDITSRKEAERALQASEEQLRLLLENSPIGVAVVSHELEGHQVVAKRHFGNKALAMMVGSGSAADMINVAVADSWVDQEQLQLVNRTMFEGGELNDFEALRVRPDGSERWVSMDSRSIQFDGRDCTVIWQHDVTLRKQAEQALRRNEQLLRGVVDNSPATIVLKDLDDTYLLVNRYVLEISETTAEQWLGHSASNFYPADLVAAFQEQDRRIISDASVIEYEYEIELPDGEMHTIVVTRFPVLDDEGTVFGIGSIGLDVTVQRRMQAQLVQAQKMEAVGQLTSGIAHDFNNLLTAVIGNLDLLRDRLSDDDTAQRYLATAQRASEHGADLIDRLLAFSRRQVLAPKPTDIHTIIPHFRGLAQRALGEQIEIRTDLADSIWPVTVDQGQLENALLNLAINANDAMPMGGQLLLEAGNQVLSQDDVAQLDDVAPGDYVEIAVSDTGEGMSDETLSRAFDPFFTTKDVGERTGLGLSMVFGFAKQSGGHVGLYSELGVGTTVRIYLPRAEEGVADAGADDEDEDRLMPQGGETVLLVEDDEDVREFVGELLSSLGYRVLNAADGAAALAIVESDQEIALLLSDVVLPGGMSGPDVATAFRAQRPAGKVILSSGYPRNHLDRQGDIPDDAAFLKKPYRVAELAQRIRQILDA